ncbi:MAG TPA: response regulator transcription factor [Thermoanaerobaculia bacterium]|nr:response regulator transcription factor [Thermoanaerobaculia bacterium]
MIRVLIVDDHDVVREGVKQMVSETGDVVVAGEAKNAGDALDAVRAQRYDVVILDLNLPDRPGLDVLTVLHNVAPTLPVLIFSMHDQPSYASRALKAGAAGYVSKNSAREHLVAAIRKVARGERFLSPELAERLAFELMESPHERSHQSLSDREFQVLCLIASGKPPRQIAQELNVSVKTVATHRTRLLAKMGWKNNADIVEYAIKNRLLADRE